MDKNSIEILKNQIINEGVRLSADNMSSLLNQISTAELVQLAGDLRKHYTGVDFDTCSIVNARSGRCSEDCKWCSQSQHFKTDVDSYPLISVSEAMSAAQSNAERGVRRFSLVTSGRKVSIQEMPKVKIIYQALTKEYDMEFCASMGLLNKSELSELWDCGVRRYHCNIESSPSFFSYLCTTHTLEDKLETIRYAQELGMEVCSGGIIGMGETMRDRIEMAELLRRIGVKSIPINVLNPIKGTPLEDSEPLTKDELLRSFAMFRVMNPDARIRFAGGRKQFIDIQREVIDCGVDAAIVGDMLTTVGAAVDDDMKMFKELGFTL